MCLNEVFFSASEGKIAPDFVPCPILSPFPARPWLKCPPTRLRRRRVRARFWLGLAAAAALSLLSSAPPWHAAVRALLVWQAARQGCDLTVGAIEGGPFDTTHLYNLRCRQRGLPPGASATGTDLSVAHAQITFAWALPWSQRAESSWVRQCTLDGVRGQLDLSPSGRRPGGAGLVGRWGRFGPFDALAPRLVPTDFLVRADDAAVRRGRYHLRAFGLFLSGSHDGSGAFRSRVVEVGGPRFNTALADQHGRTLWDGRRLTFSGLDLGDGIRLARASLDGSRLDRRRLDADFDLHALGGTVRGQGAVNFTRERLALEVGGSVQQIALGPLARLMEITGPADGQVEQASFSFRGDPESPAAAEMWLAGRATDFRWGQRRWESLEVQAVVTDRRVQVHRLELRQSRNRLSLDGECSLPPPEATATSAADADRPWWQAGFACNVDARIEDLRELARLFGPAMPDLAGRMSVNGRIGARPGTEGYDGYLNVEGSALSVRAAPLDFVRSTLLLRGGELDVADLQATRGGDYLTGHGSLHIVDDHGIVRLASAPDFQALGRVSVENLAVYAPAYAGLFSWVPDADAPPIRALTAGVRLEDSVLHLDQCRGEQGGGSFQCGGSVDLRDPAHPVLDLSLTGEQPPRIADPADADALWRAGVSYALDLRGPLDGGVAIHGDAQLVHGRFDLPGKPDAALSPTPPTAGALMTPLLRRLPAAWRDWLLDLRVTAANPLPLNRIERDDQITPEWVITGTGRQPLLGGKVGFRAAAGSGQESGAWYFSPGEPDHPTVSAQVASDDGLRGTFFYGPSDRLQTVSWGTDAAGGELTLQSSETPPPVEDAGWLATFAAPVP